MNPEEIIKRLKTIKIYAMLSKEDTKAIQDAIDYIVSNEERMKINRPNPLFPEDI